MSKTTRHLFAAVLTVNLALWGTDAVFRSYEIETKESALREDLRVMRKMIDQYAADKQRAPQTLRELVAARYLPEIPRDPMTGSSATWEIILEEDPVSLAGERGIVDVKSGSPDVDSAGETRYSDW